VAHVSGTCPTEKRRDKKIVWRFVCDCGRETETTAKAAVSGNTRSCGCLLAETTMFNSALKRVIKNCVVCGKEISVKPSHVKIEGTYCSKDCMAEDYRLIMQGNGNPNYRHGRAYEPGEYYETGQIWRAFNKDKVAAYSRNSKASRRGAEGSHTKDDIESLLLNQFGLCHWCKEQLRHYEVDHIIPLAKGGSNWPENLALACDLCNRQKRDLMPEVWFGYSNCRAKHD
jgi:5-methylcytosine-specific restriction endonuclease McrA